MAAEIASPQNLHDVTGRHKALALALARALTLAAENRIRAHDMRRETDRK